MRYALDVRDEMAKHGIECDEDPYIDGEIHRFDVPGHRRGSKNGWYVFNREGDKVYGAFGDWKSGARGTVGGSAARRVMRQVLDSKQHAMDERADLAALRASMEWRSASDERLDDNPYLSRKMVPGFGVKQVLGTLYVPMLRKGEIVGLQKIYPDGKKMFTPGCRKLGASHVIGTVAEPLVLVVAEGYATAASLHMATMLPVLVAFDCGNLLPATRMFLEHLDTKAKLIWAADNDENTAGNPGVSKARHAAKELGGKVVWPEIAGDFNDLHVAHGIESVTEAIYGCL